MAYLSVRRIAEKYGRDTMLDFWGKVVHADDSVEQASMAALGVPWSTVRTDCARYVRDQVKSA